MQEEEKKKGFAPSEIKKTKSNSFTNEELADSWNQFIERRKNLGSDQEVAFLKHNYVHENSVVTIQIHNSILELTFDKIKVELQAHLRSTLENDSIKVELEKLESSAKKMLYTNKEKFSHLTEKYPSLKLLQEKLSLDPDY